jgi:uncharacterized RDD family membrane protein YckC
MQQEQPLEFHIASTKKRLGAFVIDDIIVSIFLLVIFYSQLVELKDPMAISLFLQRNFLVFVMLKIIYQTFFVWQGGMTPGKILMKIRVVEYDGGYIPSLWTALLRAFLRIVSESLFYIGYLFAYFNPLVQTLHDKFAQTVVVDA